KSKFAIADPTRPLLPTKAPGEAPAATPMSVDRELKDVTTSSLEAYRSYVEGNDLNLRGRAQESVPFFEKAVQVDPTFALRLPKGAVVHFNLRHARLAEEYAKRAIDHADRLSGRERYYVEASYYQFTPGPESARKAIAAYEKAIELYPDHASARNNLAVL